MTREEYMQFLRPRALVSMIAGYLVWSLCFVVLYSLLSVGCEAGWHQTRLLGINLRSWLLVSSWLLHLAVGAWLLREVWKSDPEATDRSGRFIRRVTLLLDVTAFGATIWIGLPVLGLPPCI